ncbi:hypothetical protein HAX54_015429, partial [Datura stramonium]|nr:hypothetical protein [Datura stramonium]
EKVADSMPKLTHVANCTNGPLNAQAVMSPGRELGISYQDIGGPTGQLLEQNALMLDQITANFDTFKIQENNDLLIQVLGNLRSLVNNLNDSSEIMDLMPPLPVKIDEELANAILQPQPPFPKNP